MASPPDSSSPHESIRKHSPDAHRSIRHRLWWIATAPSLWAVHLLACYIAAAIWCEKVGRPASPNPPAATPLWIFVGVVTAIAVVGILIVARLSWRNFRHRDPPLPFDFDVPNERTEFLGFTAFLLSMLSLVATLMTALVFVLIRSCD